MRIVFKILTIFILVLFLFLIIIHITKIDKFEVLNTKDSYKTIYNSKQVNLSTYFSIRDNDNYNLSLSFHQINSNIKVDSLFVRVVGLESRKKTTFDNVKILAYEGMHNWDIPEFNNFCNIPNDLRILNPSKNPYFAYDFIVKNANKNIKSFVVDIYISILIDNERKIIKDDLQINKVHKIVIRPIDMHNDLSFLLMPILGFIGFIMLIIWIIIEIRKK